MLRLLITTTKGRLLYVQCIKQDDSYCTEENKSIFLYHIKGDIFF